jgi:hypothetical protein
LIFPVVLCLLQGKANAATAFYHEPSNYREEHIQTKIDGMVKEAKAKMAKGDKKGRFRRSLAIPGLKSLAFSCTQV